MGPNVGAGGERGIGKQEAAVTEQVADEICGLVAREHLSFKLACAKVGVTQRQWGYAADRYYGAKRDRAKADSVMFWIHEGLDGGRDKNNPRVRFAESMLRAQDPDRFREDKKPEGEGLRVIILQGDGQIPKITSAQVITKRKELGEGEGESGEVG